MDIDNFYIEGSDYIPEVDFNAETGVLNITGESYHEYTPEFFEPIFDWLKKFLSEEGKKVEFNFSMRYFNTSSYRHFLEIMNLLEDYQLNNNGQVTINWYHEEDKEDRNEDFF